MWIFVCMDFRIKSKRLIECQFSFLSAVWENGRETRPMFEFLCTILTYLCASVWILWLLVFQILPTCEGNLVENFFQNYSVVSIWWFRKGIRNENLFQILWPQTTDRNWLFTCNYCVNITFLVENLFFGCSFLSNAVLGW